MNKKILALFVKLLKGYPLCYNLTALALYYSYFRYKFDLSTFVFDFMGASIYTVLICFVASFLFKFCVWHKVLCVSAFLSLILEWVDLNVIKVPHFVIGIQVIIIAGLVTALFFSLYERRIKAKDNTSLEKVNYQVKNRVL